MRPVEFEVAGVTFYVDRMDAFEALSTFGDLQKDLLPSLGGLLALLGDDDSASEDALSGAVAKLSQSLNGKQLEYWCDRLLTKDRVSVEVAGEVKKLDKATRLVVFESFTDILELLYHVIKMEFYAPLVSWLGRVGLGQKLQDALSDVTAKK